MEDIAIHVPTATRRLPRPALSARALDLLAWQRWERPLVIGNAVAAFAAATILVVFGGRFGIDVQGFWSGDPFHPYVLPDYGAPGAYFYSPTFALVFAPLHLLPFPVVVGLVVVLDLLALRFLVGRWAGYAMLLLPVMHEVIGANINLPLTAAIVAGFRFPVLWTFVLITKVTPGIGLLWFAVRREWRALASVAVVTLALVGVSYLVAPDAWARWFALLADNAARPPSPYALPIPLWIRLIGAAVLVVWGARSNQRWVVPVAAFLGIAVVWQIHWVLLFGVIPLIARTDRWRRWWAAYSGRPPG